MTLPQAKNIDNHANKNLKTYIDCDTLENNTGNKFYKAAKGPWMLKLFTMIFMSFFAVTSASSADEVKIGVEDFEPYFIENGSTGIIVDIISAVFNHIPDRHPVFIFGHSNKRLLSDFKNGKFDAVPNLNKDDNIEGCLSDPAFIYNNVAITRADSGIVINSLSDLTGKSLVAFQGAREALASEFANSVTKEIYTEVPQPLQQSIMLIRERAEVNVGDKLIFLNSLKMIQHPDVKQSDFKFHPIFPRTYTYMGFRDKKLCKQFNDGLKLLHSNGEYEKIYQGYMSALE